MRVEAFILNLTSQPNEAGFFHGVSAIFDIVLII